MNKKDMVLAMAKRTGMTQKDCASALGAALKVIREELRSGGSVLLVGFGCFEVKLHMPRKALNPKTREKILLPTYRAPVFRPGKHLRELVGDRVVE